MIITKIGHKNQKSSLGDYQTYRATVAQGNSYISTQGERLGAKRGFKLI